MIIVPVKDGEGIDRPLKRFKRKFDKTQVLKRLRERKQFTKKSVLRRKEIIKAAYVQKKEQNED